MKYMSRSSYSLSVLILLVLKYFFPFLKQVYKRNYIQTSKETSYKLFTVSTINSRQLDIFPTSSNIFKLFF